MNEINIDYTAGLKILKSSISSIKRKKRSLQKKIDNIKSDYQAEKDIPSDNHSLGVVFLSIGVFVLILYFNDHYLISHLLYQWIILPFDNLVNWILHRIIGWFIEGKIDFYFGYLHLITLRPLGQIFDIKNFNIQWLAYVQLLISMTCLYISLMNFKNSKDVMKKSIKIKWENKIKDLKVLIDKENKKLKKKEKDLKDFISQSQQELEEGIKQKKKWISKKI